MEAINIALKIINFLIILTAICLSSIGFMHMFQLNSYQIKSHYYRIKQNPGQLIPNIIFPLVSAVSLLLKPTAAYIYIDCVFLLAAYVNRPKKAKKPLVYTPRVKRQLIALAILNIIIIVASDIIWGSFGRVSAMIYLYLLTPVMIIISALICKPIEKHISNGFIKDAKKILASKPDMRIIGVTGSYGKTSVKHYLNTLLKAKYNVLITPGSFNTPMGVVRTIREHLKPADEIFVCEMGARHVGDIKEICDIVHPHDGIITSIGPQHLETFYTLDNIKKTKFELADSLGSEGILFANMDDENVASCLKGRKYIAYGIKNKEGYYAENISVSERGTTFSAVSPNGEKCEYTTKLIGMHNVLNIVGAIAVANTYGIPMQSLKSQVRKIECVPHRLYLKDHGAVAIIDDAYNSNPSGAKAALEVFGVFDGYRILVTPGMVELGEKQDECNYEFGANASKVCDYVILVGKKQTESIYKGLSDSGYDLNKIFVADTIDEAIKKAYAVDSMGKKKYILLENDLPDNY